MRAASCKQQGFGESALNSAIENEGDSPLPPGERALLEFVERFNEGRFDPLAVPTTIVPWDRADEAWLQPATKLVLERE